MKESFLGPYSEISYQYNIWGPFQIIETPERNNLGPTNSVALFEYQ